MLDGTLRSEGRSYDVQPGFVATAGAARQWFGEPGTVPFLTTTLAYTISRSKTVADTATENALTASDLRLGALFGYAPVPEWSPYAVARVFAGPVGWRDMVGSDRHHYALGAGTGFAFDPLELSLEATFLGERSASIGVTLAIE